MKYRKKPVVIEAVQVTWADAKSGYLSFNEDPNWLTEAIRDGIVNYFPSTAVIQIKTLEGVMEAKFGDYIIRGVKGEIYPIKSDIFLATYEGIDVEN